MQLALLADLTQLLAETFLEPEADLTADLAQIQDGDPAPALAEPLGRMVGHGLGPDQPVEYARLFLHARDTDTVHLFESVQARGEHLAPEVLGPLQALYDEAEISVQEDLATPPDHLGLELACLNYLLVQVIEGDLAERPRFVGLAQRLLHEHLTPFAAAVADQLPRVSPLPYYLAALDLTRALLPEIQRELAEF
jgi:TorA maturation chaperone TorD